MLGKKRLTLFIQVDIAKSSCNTYLREGFHASQMDFSLL